MSNCEEPGRRPFANNADYRFTNYRSTNYQSTNLPNQGASVEELYNRLTTLKEKLETIRGRL